MLGFFAPKSTKDVSDRSRGTKSEVFPNTATTTRYDRAGGCSATRAALLTGRNHHQSGNGSITELASGYSGDNSVWPRDAESIAEILKSNGYSTSAFGKWHYTPDWETTPIGPFERWPNGLGFQYWYGFPIFEPFLALNLEPKVFGST